MKLLKIKWLKLFRKNLQNRGFGLIEIMIAGLILGVSLLGIASMQSKALNITIEADRKEVALRMIHQLTSFALTADPTQVQYMADPNINLADVGVCYNAASPCDKATFYKTTVLEWQNIMLTMFPNGRGCTCIASPTTITVSGNSINMTLRIAIKWTSLYGVPTVINVDTYIPSAIISNPIPNKCPVDGTMCGFAA